MMNELPQLLGHLMLSIEGKAEVSEEHHGVVDFCIYLRKRFSHLSAKEFLVAQIVVSLLVNYRTIEKRWIGMPVMSRQMPNSFKTPLDQEKVILLSHCWGIVG